MLFREEIFISYRESSHLALSCHFVFQRLMRMNLRRAPAWACHFLSPTSVASCADIYWYWYFRFSLTISWNTAIAGPRATAWYLHLRCRLSPSILAYYIQASFSRTLYRCPLFVCLICFFNIFHYTPRNFSCFKIHTTIYPSWHSLPIWYLRWTCSFSLLGISWESCRHTMMPATTILSKAIIGQGAIFHYLLLLVSIYNYFSIRTIFNYFIYICFICYWHDNVYLYSL